MNVVALPATDPATAEDTATAADLTVVPDTSADGDPDGTAHHELNEPTDESTAGPGTEVSA